MSDRGADHEPMDGQRGDRRAPEDRRTDADHDSAGPEELLIVMMSDGPSVRIRDRFGSGDWTDDVEQSGPRPGGGDSRQDPIPAGDVDLAPTAALRTSEISAPRAERDTTPTMLLRVQPADDQRQADARRAAREHGAARPSRRRAGRRRRHPFLWTLFVMVLVATAYYGFTLWQVYSVGRSDQLQQVDAIVVMGAAQYDGRPSPQLAARLDHVVELWPQDLAPMVVVTGGNRPGDRFTEAGASAQYLIDRGVPADSIILEDAGTTSFDSLTRVETILTERTGRDDSSVLIVTDPFHALRSRMIAAQVGLSASVSPTTTSVVTGANSVRRHAVEAGGVAVGRIIGFDRLERVTG